MESGLGQPDILTAAVQGRKASHHLVMPADANAATLRRWVGEHAPHWSDVLITRLDESAQPWPLLQACCEHQLCPAMASDGGGLTQLRQPFDAQALLQHGMAVLAQLPGAGGHPGHAGGRDTPPAPGIPPSARTPTTVPQRTHRRRGRPADPPGQ